MGGGMYRPWWAIEERKWLTVIGVPLCWAWQRIEYFNELEPAQNWVRNGAKRGGSK